jgi:hypothetical protein
MPRKLKTYQTSIGFYDFAIAAPSMKAALEAWGAGSNLFHQGIAKETDDPDVVAATMAKPGVVLRRPAGSSGGFAEHAELPTELNADKGHGKRRPSKKRPPAAISESDARKAALSFEREQKRREAERRREEAASARARERREKAAAKAEAALDQARREHEAKAQAIEAEREAVEQRASAEEKRWHQLKGRLEAELRKARES